MKQFVTAFVVLTALVVTISCSSSAAEAESCDSCVPILCDSCGASLFDGRGRNPSQWEIRGHLQAGRYANEYGWDNVYYSTGYKEYGNNSHLLNVADTDERLNQGYIFVQRKLNTSRGWDVGGKISYMYGTDARFVQAAGLETATSHGAWLGPWDKLNNYSAIPEMYVEVGRKDFSLKVGKFLSMLGHESILSTERFFYSLSQAYGELPKTHTGVVATWDVNSKLNVFGGWVNGPDSFFDTGEDNALLGGATYRFNDRLYAKYVAMAGMNTKAKEVALPYWGYREWSTKQKYFMHSFIVGVKPGKQWDFTFEWTLRNTNADYAKNPDGPGYDPTYFGWFSMGGYGINTELIYRFNRQWAVGLRAEWTHRYAEDYFRGKLDKYYEYNDLYSFTLAANWTPTKWLTVRPEMRYDKFDGRDDYFNLIGTPKRNKQFSGGISVTVQF